MPLKLSLLKGKKETMLLGQLEMLSVHRVAKETGAVLSFSEAPVLMTCMIAVDWRS